MVEYWVERRTARLNLPVKKNFRNKILRPVETKCLKTSQGNIEQVEANNTVFDQAGRIFLILIAGLIVLHCTGTSNTKISDTARNADLPNTVTKFAHAWPESIDVDQKDNIYFTDAYEGSLYRLTRNADGELKGPEEKLIEGLKRASGISIDRNDHALYMGLALKSDHGTEYKIARIPLEIFTICERRPYVYEALKVCARTQQNEILESNIPKVPNGVVFHRNSQTVYYTNIALSLSGWLFKKKGYIGSVRLDSREAPTIIEHIFSPNGIDVEPVQDGLALIVTTTLDSRIHRILLRNGEAEEFYSSSLDTSKNVLLGNFPDGLIRRSDGSILVAAFGSGKVFYLSNQGNHFSDPVEIVRGLGNPTDLTFGRASTGSGTSLYVTTKKGGILPWKSISQGRVVEIADIEEKIEAAKKIIFPMSPTGHGGIETVRKES